MGHGFAKNTHTHKIIGAYVSKNKLAYGLEDWICKQKYSLQKNDILYKLFQASC
jgi:hypothetical protein